MYVGSTSSALIGWKDRNSYKPEEDEKFHKKIKADSFKKSREIYDKELLNLK